MINTLTKPGVRVAARYRPAVLHLPGIQIDLVTLTFDL